MCYAAFGNGLTGVIYFSFNLHNMNLYHFNDFAKKWSTVNERCFEDEKEIQEIVEKNLERFFGLKLIKSEFKMQASIGGKDGRPDSLCFDESRNSFVLVEYKKINIYESSNCEDMMAQGFTYQNFFENSTNQSNCTDAYNENITNTKEALLARKVKWDNTRVFFVFPYFPNLTKSFPVDEKKFQFWEIKRFSNDAIVLNHLNPLKESVKQEKHSTRKQNKNTKVSSPMNRHEPTGNTIIPHKTNDENASPNKGEIEYTEEYHLEKTKKGGRYSYFKNIYYDIFKKRVLDFGNVVVKPKKTVIGFWVEKGDKSKMFFIISIQKDSLIMFINLKKAN